MQRDQARERLMKLPAAQRDAWLDIAEEEFRTLGFTAASLNRILARSGLSKGQAYYYFASKGELYRAVITRALDTVGAELGLALPQPSSSNAFWGYIAELFSRISHILKHNQRLADLGRGIYGDAAAQSALGDILVELSHKVELLIEAGRQSGAVRTDIPASLLAAVVFAAAQEVDRWFALNTQHLPEADVLELNQRVMSLFVAMLSPATIPGDLFHPDFFSKRKGS